LPSPACDRLQKKAGANRAGTVCQTSNLKDGRVVLIHVFIPDNLYAEDGRDGEVARPPGVEPGFRG
jgi:hypothetical protein